MKTQFEYFAVCAPGVERVLLAEVQRLGFRGAAAVVGGVQGRTDWTGLWDLHLQSALAESVRVRLKSFDATTFVALEIGLRRLPWHAFLRPGQTVDVSVTCHKSKLYHSDAVKVRVERAIATVLAKGRAVRDAGPPARVFVRLARDVVTPSIDASGERLHRRGYRAHVEEAPLRETLAAAMVQLLDGLCAKRGAAAQAVWDPFCGSGVLPLEWLRHGRGEHPGDERGFAFEAWPTFPNLEWQAYREKALTGEARGADLRAWGSDLDAKAVGSAQANAERAGLGEVAQFAVGDFRTAVQSVPLGAAVLSNPPYGKRLGSAEQARRLYRELGLLLAKRTDLRPVVLACPDPSFLGKDAGWTVLAKTRNGGIPLTFVGLA